MESIKRKIIKLKKETKPARRDNKINDVIVYFRRDAKIETRLQSYIDTINAIG